MRPIHTHALSIWQQNRRVCVCACIHAGKTRDDSLTAVVSAYDITPLDGRCSSMLFRELGVVACICSYIMKILHHGKSLDVSRSNPESANKPPMYMCSCLFSVPHGFTGPAKTGRNSTLIAPLPKNLAMWSFSSDCLPARLPVVLYWFLQGLHLAGRCDDIGDLCRPRKQTNGHSTMKHPHPGTRSARFWCGPGHTVHCPIRPTVRQWARGILTEIIPLPVTHLTS